MAFVSLGSEGKSSASVSGFPLHRHGGHVGKRCSGNAAGLFMRGKTEGSPAAMNDRPSHVSYASTQRLQPLRCISVLAM